jgi:hypothetical protein
LKHAGADTLDQLEALLAKMRELAGLRERKRGAFYRGTSAFLHFHEDPAGLFADLKIGRNFVRFSVDNQYEIETLLNRAVNELSRSAETGTAEQTNAATRTRSRGNGREKPNRKPSAGRPASHRKE